jgi:hypothetical protein
MTSFLLLL